MCEQAPFTGGPGRHRPRFSTVNGLCSQGWAEAPGAGVHPICSRLTRPGRAGRNESATLPPLSCDSRSSSAERAPPL